VTTTGGEGTYRGSTAATAQLVGPTRSIPPTAIVANQRFIHVIFSSPLRQCVSGGAQATSHDDRVTEATAAHGYISPQSISRAKATAYVPVMPREAARRASSRSSHPLFRIFHGPWRRASRPFLCKFYNVFAARNHGPGSQCFYHLSVPKTLNY
jgi:hypothetical protein